MMEVNSIFDSNASSNGGSHEAANAVQEQPKADGYDFVREVEERMVRAAHEAATEVYRKASDAGRQEDDADIAGLEVFTVVRLAVEAAAAKVAGYESWAAFEAAQAQCLIGDIS